MHPITEKFLYFHALDVWRIEKITIFAGSKVVTSAAGDKTHANFH